MLLRWLDDGLRRGERGRLGAELALGSEADPGSQHAVAWLDGQPASHAMARVIDVTAAGCLSRLGLIGLVYTEPAARGRGLASRCIELCCAELEKQRARLVALWSDRERFYARLGFRPGGRERTFVLDSTTCARAAQRLPPPGPVRAVRAADWSRLETLYGEKPSHALRAAGALARLARAPGCEVRVCEQRGRAIAYTALGRGDDFPGVVHEWAGESAGVLACLAALAATRGRIGWLLGPVDEGPAALLRAAGAGVHERCFALLRPIDPLGLWHDVLGSAAADVRAAPAADGLRLEGAGRGVALDAAQLLQLLLGPSRPASIAAALDPAQSAALDARLPWPLFVWGFDSI